MTLQRRESGHRPGTRPPRPRHIGLGLAMCLLVHAAHAEQTAPAPDPHGGGTLLLTASAAAGTIDPHINYLEKFNQIYAFLFDGLLTFRKAGGDAGSEVVPDLATAMPAVTDGGRTFRFTLRRGIRFSNGQEVGVADVTASFRRIFQVSGPNAGNWYSVLVGADACLASPATCTLKGGVETDAATNTVTLHLTKPSGDFLDQLAMSFAVILPASTPPHDLGTQAPPGTGPYTIESYDPTRAMRIVRNPYFHEWSAAAQPAGHVDAMTYRFGLQDESETTDVLRGTQDWMFDEKPLDRLAEIGGRYAAQARLTPQIAYYYLELNTRLAPFDNQDARRAVAYAVNRRALINLYGGPGLGTPLCQLLPRGLPGYEPYCPYTAHPLPAGAWSAPDLERARALVRKSGTAGMAVTLITSDKEVERTMGIYLQSMLTDIGYRAGVRALSSNIDFTYMQNTNNHVQIGLSDWYQDYPSAADFLGVMFSCRSFHPGSDASINMSGFCDPAIESKMDAADLAAVTDRAAAARMWADIDRRITDAAPAVGLFQIDYLDILSPRVGNFVSSPIYRMLFSQAWVQ